MNTSRTESEAEPGHDHEDSVRTVPASIANGRETTVETVDQRNIHTPSLRPTHQHPIRPNAPIPPYLMSPTDSNDPTDIREIQTTRLRRSRADERTVIVSITEAIRAAGLSDGGSFRFDPGAVDALGMLPAIGSEEPVDGRGEPLVRNIRQEGNQRSTLRLVIPPRALAALLDPDEIDWNDPPSLNVWAGDRLLAFEVPPNWLLTADGGPNKDREGYP